MTVHLSSDHLRQSQSWGQMYLQAIVSDFKPPNQQQFYYRNPATKVNLNAKLYHASICSGIGLTWIVVLQIAILYP